MCILYCIILCIKYNICVCTYYIHIMYPYKNVIYYVYNLCTCILILTNLSHGLVEFCRGGVSAIPSGSVTPWHISFLHGTLLWVCCCTWSWFRLEPCKNLGLQAAEPGIQSSEHAASEISWSISRDVSSTQIRLISLLCCQYLCGLINLCSL